MSDLIKRIDCFAKMHNMIKPEATILVGLSGGPDSMFLLHTLTLLSRTTPCSIVAAHLDHGWRAESHHDLLFCAEQCALLTVPFVAKRLTQEDYAAIPQRNKGSREEQGRWLRRRFFEAVGKEHGCSLIALGHHRDDNAETFFIRLIRGASITGLTGIKPQDGIYIHPLLCCTKQEILSFLSAHNIPFVQDKTNDSDLFLRNRIRHRALPALEQCDKRFLHSLANVMAHLQETETFLEELSRHVTTTLTRPGSNELAIDPFLNQPSLLQKRILMTWLLQQKCPFTPSNGLFEEIIRFLRQKKSTRHLIYNSFYIVKSRGYARLEQKI